MMNNAMELIDINFIKTHPYINPNEVESFSFKRKQNGEMVGIVKTTGGVTFIKTISPDGAELTTMIKIPFFSSIEARNNQILDFYVNKKFTQTDIAIFMGLSQSQVSYIINSLNNRAR